MIYKFTKQSTYITIIVCIAVAPIIIGLPDGLTRNRQTDDIKRKPSAITAVAPECAEIGKDILLKNGCAVDAAIAILFCDGALTMQTMGLGGGFLATIYTKSTGIVETLNARETAPAAAFKEMFDNLTIVEGPLSIAVPGELKGYAALYERYGTLEWSDLIQPTIDLCRNGFPISSILSQTIKKFEALIRSDEEFSKLFVDPITTKLYTTGDIIKRPKLAATLELIAKTGADTLYTKTGKLANDLIKELNSRGAIITIDDLVNYNIAWQEPISATIFHNLTLYSMPLPGSGSVLIFILNILKDFLPTEKSIVYYQRLIETFKFAYAQRTKLGDPKFAPEAIAVANNLTDLLFADKIRLLIRDNKTSQNYTYYGAEYTNKEDHGTAHVSVLASNGDAVSITSTINRVFGSTILSKSTGIILNDEMDDFSIPGLKNVTDLKPSPANYIEAGKTPFSSMCPSIIVDKHGDVQLIIGAAGGTRITTSVANIITSVLHLNESLDEAVKEWRLHHQLSPMHIEYETGFSQNILDGLLKLGHVIFEHAPDGFSSATAISQWSGKIIAVSDSRRNGTAVVVQ